MKKSLTSLVLLSALTFSGCSVSDVIHKIPSIFESKTDLVSMMKKHPEVLEQFLSSHIGERGLMPFPGLGEYEITFNFTGKDDELFVSAIYKIVPSDSGLSMPVLSSYIVYDSQDKTTTSYTRSDIPTPSAPEVPTPSSDKYRLDEKNSS